MASCCRAIGIGLAIGLVVAAGVGYLLVMYGGDSLVAGF